MDDATVEPVARAMWDAREKTLPERTRVPFDDRLTGDIFVMARAAIAAHKAALAESGYVIVKRQPTDEMLMAGHLSGEWDRNCVEGEEATPEKCWRAMIEAHNP